MYHMMGFAPMLAPVATDIFHSYQNNAGRIFVRGRLLALWYGTARLRQQQLCRNKSAFVCALKHEA